EKKREGKKKKSSKKEPVFSDGPIDFGWLKKVDVDVAIEVESFAKEQFLAKSAQFQIRVKSGVLSINPARFVYPKGKLDMDLELDGRERPHLTFKAFGEHIDPRRALDIQQYKKELQAEMNIDLSFSTSGLTPHEMAANSQGSIYITMQNGKLAAPLADLVFWDVAGWAWKKATDQKYYDITCGVADYSMDRGVISTDAFILDTEHITVTGVGTIDLGGEKVDYVLVPKKKSLKMIQKADPVNIKGPLNNPKVSTLPWKSAAITAAKVGGIILAPFIFIPLTAADYLAGQVTIKDGKSACLEYQKTRKMEKRPQ
ncbi:MAG: AsmA family protein, partial [Syntrophobacterales bacterium]